MDPVEYKAPAAVFGMRRMLAAQPSGFSLPLLPVYATMACTSDVNGDGKIDLADLQLLAAMATGEPNARCDLNGDGKVNLDDFQLVLDAILGDGGAAKTQIARPGPGR
jgi:hypothetical protein